jgi:hypothetical protein
MERKDSKERSGKEGGKEGFFRAVKGFVKEKLVQPVEKLVQDPFAPQHDRECRPSSLGIILAFSFSVCKQKSGEHAVLPDHCRGKPKLSMVGRRSTS